MVQKDGRDFSPFSPKLRLRPQLKPEVKKKPGGFGRRAFSLERVNGLEPSTCTLARYRSTN
jgi:hypothetical protein